MVLHGSVSGDLVADSSPVMQSRRVCFVDRVLFVALVYNDHTDLSFVVEEIRMVRQRSSCSLRRLMLLGISAPHTSLAGSPPYPLYRELQSTEEGHTQ